MFLAIAVDNLADAESLTAAEKAEEHEEAAMEPEEDEPMDIGDDDYDPKSEMRAALVKTEERALIVFKTF